MKTEKKNKTILFEFLKLIKRNVKKTGPIIVEKLAILLGGNNSQEGKVMGPLIELITLS